MVPVQVHLSVLVRKSHHWSIFHLKTITEIFYVHFVFYLNKLQFRRSSVALTLQGDAAFNCNTEKIHACVSWQVIRIESEKYVRVEKVMQIATTQWWKWTMAFVYSSRSDQESARFLCADVSWRQDWLNDKITIDMQTVTDFNVWTLAVGKIIQEARIVAPVLNYPRKGQRLFYLPPGLTLRRFTFSTLRGFLHLFYSALLLVYKDEHGSKILVRQPVLLTRFVSDMRNNWHVVMTRPYESSSSLVSWIKTYWMCHFKNNFDFEIIKVVHFHNFVIVSFSEIVIVRNIYRIVLRSTYTIDARLKFSYLINMTFWYVQKV